MRLFFSIAMCFLLTGCWGVSDTHSKSSMNKDDKGSEIKYEGDINKAPEAVKLKLKEHHVIIAEKNKDSNLNISGFLVPALGAGCLLFAISTIVLMIGSRMARAELTAWKAQATGGLSVLWDAGNAFMRHATDVNSSQYKDGESVVQKVEMLASSLGIKL